MPLVAPTTPPEEVERIAQAARGFVYVVSVTGVTGERAALPPGLGEVVERVRAAADVPVAVGFGVGTPAQVAEVGRIADGVIVGSRLVRAIQEAETFEAGLEDVRSFLGDSVRALSSPASTNPTAEMWVFLGFTAGMCLLIVLWATGLAVDAAGVFALAILGIGVLAQMVDSRPGRDEP